MCSSHTGLQCSDYTRIGGACLLLHHVTIHLGELCMGYWFCYQSTGSTTGERVNISTVLLLEDKGADYTIVIRFTVAAIPGRDCLHVWHTVLCQSESECWKPVWGQLELPWWSGGPSWMPSSFCNTNNLNLQTIIMWMNVWCDFNDIIYAYMRRSGIHDNRCFSIRNKMHYTDICLSNHHAWCSYL